MSLKDFLKKYSPIPNSFVEDLFDMYGTSTLQSDPVVNLDAVAKWLGVRKDSLVTTLRTSYKKDVDYATAVGTKPTSARGGRNRAEVLLTPDCFKRLCMRSRGHKAEGVRTYFIMLEGLVLKYKDQLMDGMQAEIERLERQRGPKGRPGRAPTGGYIYVVRASEKMDSVYKIGRTVDLRRRLREHETSRADDLEVMFVFRVENVDAVERCVKVTLSEKRYRPYKEVFKLDLDVLKAIVNGCDQLQGMLKLEHKAKGPGELTGGCYMCTLRDTEH